MIVNLEKHERDLLVEELEKTAIPEIRGLIASKMRKMSRDEMKHDEVELKTILEKLRKAA